MSEEGFKRKLTAILIGPHQAAVTDNIGAEDSGKFAFKTFLSHEAIFFCYGFKQNENLG